MGSSRKRSKLINTYYLRDIDPAPTDLAKEHGQLTSTSNDKHGQKHTDLQHDINERKSRYLLPPTPCLPSLNTLFCKGGTTVLSGFTPFPTAACIGEGPVLPHESLDTWGSFVLLKVFPSDIPLIVLKLSPEFRRLIELSTV